MVRADRGDGPQPPAAGTSAHRPPSIVVIMTEQLNSLMAEWHSAYLLLTMALSILVLGKGADWLVEQAVALSIRSGMPRVVVGATVVSLGTTAPEAVVSVLAAFQGEPGVALGNAVGSIICDTGLILGLACLVRPLQIDRQLVNRQGWVQFGCGLLLIALSFPWQHPGEAWRSGGRLPWLGGCLLVVLLVVYMIWSIRLAATSRALPDVSEESDPVASVGQALGRMLVALLMVLISSQVLIVAATLLAERLHVPPSIIAATMIAFGTSLPELIVVMTATLKGQGELAVGNVVGADILNVLFVAGAAAAATPSGLDAERHFFWVHFPGMLLILLVFRVGVCKARADRLTRGIGILLLAVYVAIQVLSYVVTGGASH